MATNSDQNNKGKIVEIKGVVIDAVFPNELPQIYSALRIIVDDRELIAEVQQHLGTTASAPSRWTRPTGSRAGWKSRTRASRSPCPSGTRRSAGSGT